MMWVDRERKRIESDTDLGGSDAMRELEEWQKSEEKDIGRLEKDRLVYR